MLFRQSSNANAALVPSLPEIKSHSKKPSIDSMKSGKSPRTPHDNPNPIIQKAWKACEKMLVDLTKYLMNESHYVTIFKMNHLPTKREGRIAQFVLYDLKDYQHVMMDLSNISKPSSENVTEAITAIQNIKDLYILWQNRIKELRAFDLALYTWINDTNDLATLKKLSLLIKNINKWQSNSEREKQLQEWTQKSIRHSEVSHSKSHKISGTLPEHSIADQEKTTSSADAPQSFTQKLILQLHKWMENPDNKIELKKLIILIDKSQKAAHGAGSECRFKKTCFDSSQQLGVILTDAIKECEVFLFNAKNMSSYRLLPKITS
ncbi:MAG: hypothetical protein ACYCQI_04440 [Gammaproteobacteria bacterium]